MYKIDRDVDIPLYIQIRESITKAIDEGGLQPGDRLPPVSALAKEIGVTQATIRRALKDLGNAGHIYSHVGRGTFICDANAIEAGAAVEGDGNFSNSTAMDRGNQSGSQYRSREQAARRLRTGVSKALHDIIPLAHKPGIIALTKGTPDEKMIPESFLEESCQQTLLGNSAKYIQATDSAGMYELREEIARRASQDGSKISPDMVMITNGVMQAISLIGQYMMEQQPEIICETPCFQGIPNSFASMGHWVETVQRDEQGPVISQMERYTGKVQRLLYLCPYAHNPMGTDLSPERYNYLMEWARETGAVVVADEIFKDLHYGSTSHPSLIKELGGEQTIVVSSLSKSIMTGMRIGWIITSPQRIQELVQLKRLMDHSSPALMQGIALSIFKSGKYDSYTKSMRLVYRNRMDIMQKSLKKMMPKGVRWSQPDGGFSMLLELPSGYSSVALLLTAIDMGVSFLPGPLFDIDQRYVHGLRLSTAWSDENEIKEGVELLAQAIEDFIGSPPCDTGLSGLGGFQ